jgi:hypothetical protein
MRVDKPTTFEQTVSGTIPPEIAAEATWRLGWLGLIYAGARRPPSGDAVTLLPSAAKRPLAARTPARPHHRRNLQAFACPVRSSDVGSVVQWGARRHGIAGILGNPGNVVSVTYRF